MPAKPSSAWRLAEALPVLRASEEEWNGPRQRAFRVLENGRVAQVLRYCGIQRPGGALASRRQDLVERLERIAGDGGPIGR